MKVNRAQSSLLDCTFCHTVRRRFYHYHRRATSNKLHRPVNPPPHFGGTSTSQKAHLNHNVNSRPHPTITEPPQPHLYLTAATICIQHIIMWTLAGHRYLFDFISCEMGNQPLPPECCRTGGDTAQINIRRGLRCPDCLRALSYCQVLRRQSAPALFNRQAVDSSRNRGASLISEGLRRLAVVSLPAIYRRWYRVY